jgi:hypothetical protein
VLETLATVETGKIGMNGSSQTYKISKLVWDGEECWMPASIHKDIQVAVDQYVRLYEQQKTLKEELDALRHVIEPYMKEQGLQIITATDGRARLELSQQQRPVMNARYTTYDIQDIIPLLSASVRKKCVVEVVDKEKLEALHKLGEVPADVLARKVTKPTYSFTVRSMANH